jgi:hypothetical protein
MRRRMTLQWMKDPAFGTQMPAHGSVVGVRIGRIITGKNDFKPGNGGTYIFAPQAGSRYLNNPDPNLALFSESRARNLTPLPAVLYRVQETNAAFPNVSGDVIQVSPRIERIAWRKTGPSNNEAEFMDPHVIPGSMLSDDNNVDLFLLDRRPVQRGAKYRYYLTRFEPNGEIDTIFDLGTIDIP